MIFLDIETTGRCADTSSIAAIGLILPNEEIKTIFASNLYKEKDCIVEFLNVLKKFEKEVIVVWYSNFDIPFLVTRALLHNIDISFIYNFEILDLWEMIRKNLKLQSNKLEDVSKFFEIQKKLNLTGKEIRNLYMQAISGNEDAKNKIIEHCIDDLKATKEIYKRVEKYVEIWKNKNKNNFNKKSNC